MKKWKTTSEAMLVKIKREQYLRSLWVAYIDKHFPVKGMLHRRFDTKPINFEAIYNGEPCSRCGQPVPQHIFGLLQTLCKTCRTLQNKHQGDFHKKRLQKKHREELRKEGKRARLDRIEKTSAGTLRLLFAPPESSQHWPPLGSLSESLTRDHYGFKMTFCDRMHWFEGVLTPQYVPAMLYERWVEHNGKIRKIFR